ncbi:MAG TPA: AMP-binding protein [Verrucomicrobium sp.]|nr:AMP-binding protein [Verrucomicrobium sp.]
MESTLPACFEKRVLHHGARKAFGSGGWKPDYRELNAAANRQAHALLAHGLLKGERVAILMTHEAELVAGVLGVLKTGAIVVVLNPTDPPARLDQVLEDAEPRMLLTDARNKALAQQLAGDRRGIVGFEDCLSSEHVENPAIALAADDVAVLIYTSGSTGRPKGVMATHRSFLHHVYRSTLGMDVRATDRIVVLASLGGIQGLACMATGLLNGASICLFSVATKGVANLARWMVDHSITVYISAASVFRQFVKTLQESAPFPHLRIVRIGAESASSEEFANFKRYFADDCVLVHSFSSSETGNVTRLRLTKADSIPKGRLPAGHAAEDVRILLLDDRGNNVAIGETGEIVIQSRYLAAGYWRNEALTEQRFCPVEGEPGLREYRGGDMGRFTPEGMLQVLGRKDDFVKIRGFGVELAEVQEALLLQPGISSAAVCPHKDARGEMQILAFMVPETDHFSSSDSLREALQRSLPAHMIPSALVFREALPLTPTGKLDRQKLLEDFDKLLTSDKLAPRTDLEVRIARVWNGILGSGSLGVYDNFFEAGGDSLRAVDLISRLSVELSQPLPLELLINFPTVAQMAEAMEAGFVEFKEKPWFRWWRASLLPLRRTEGGGPLIFIPGGYASETELLAGMGLLPHLDPDRPMHGVRLNLLARRVLPPFSLRSMARKIARKVLEASGGKPPVIIGECLACALAYETAQILACKLGRAPLLVLLDPSHPRKVTHDGSDSLDHHPAAIARYYRLARAYEPGAYQGEIHVVCAQESQRLQTCLGWWSSRSMSTCHGHEVPGNHETYIRQHRKSLGETLDSICRQGGSKAAGTSLPSA